MTLIMAMDRSSMKTILLIQLYTMLQVIEKPQSENQRTEQPSQIPWMAFRLAHADYT